MMLASNATIAKWITPALSARNALKMVITVDIAQFCRKDVQDAAIVEIPKLGRKK